MISWDNPLYSFCSYRGWEPPKPVCRSIWFFGQISQSHGTISLTILQVEKEGVRQETRAAAAPLQVAENPRLPAIEAGRPSFLYIHSFILLFIHEYGYLREVYIGEKAMNYWGVSGSYPAFFLPIATTSNKKFWKWINCKLEMQMLRI